MSAAVSADWETSDVAVPVVVRDASTHSANGTADGEAVDAAAASLRGLRLDSAPPGDRRQQQPSPQHALYDPNASYAQPVSPATATAAVARFGQLDPVLLAGLENARERLSLLKLEDQIVRFVRNPREAQLSLPPLSSYHRLIVHRLADRCGLEHQTADFGGYDGNSARGVTLFKTAQTALPRVLLIDLSADMQAPAVTPASAPKIMVRKRNAARGGPGTNGGRGGADGGDPKNQQRSIEDRERAYAEARARIFGEDESSSTSSSSSAAATATATASNAANGNGAGHKFGGSAQASGPDGSRGFGRGSGGRGTVANTQNSNRQQQQQPRDAPSPPSRGNHNSSSSGRGSNGHANANSKGGDTQQQNWKESKVLWRNREQELNDPDFTRNHDAYRPSRDQHYSGGGGGRFGGHQQQGYYYDGPRSYGYHGAAQAGYPVRGRGGPPPPNNEYSRIDPMQHRHLHQGTPPPPPPPPSDYYRHHAQQAPPPPPQGAYNASYSPHGRGGGYGSGGAPPPPPPSSSSQQLRRGSAGGSYNDDFPPLGK